MRGGAHLGIGAGSTVLLLYGIQALGAPLDPLTIVFGAMAAGAGALSPDVDHPRSTASNGLPDKLVEQAVEMAVSLVFLGAVFASFAGKAVAASMMTSFAPLLKMAGVMIAVAIAFVSASKIARRYTTHRGVTHSFFMAAVATLAVTLVFLVASLPAWYGLLFGWGWLTHLALDATTKMGLPALMWWPFHTSQAVVAVSAPVSVPVRPAAPSPAPAILPVPSLIVEPAVPLCPKCGVPMVLRTAKRGSRSGSKFYGCDNYPACRQTKPA